MRICRKAFAQVAAIAAAGFVGTGACLGDVSPAVSGSTYTFDVAENVSETYSQGLAGSGVTLVKTGKGKLTLSGDAAYTFTGAIQIREGTLAAAPKCFLKLDDSDGKWKSLGSPSVTISKGACFDVTGAGGADWAPGQPFGALSIAGSGPDGNGALIRLNNASETGAGCDFLMFGDWDLADDAVINLGCRYRSQNMRLNGFRLTKKGAGNWYFFNKSITPGERSGSAKGQIDVLGGDISWQGGDWNGDSGTRLLLDGCGKLTLYANKGAGTAFCPYAVVVTNSAFSFVADSTGTVTGGNRFTGPVTLHQDATLTAKTGSGLTFEGKVSGNGHKVTTAGEGSVRFRGGIDCPIETAWAASFNPQAAFQCLTGTEPYHLDGQFNKACSMTLDRASFVRFGGSLSSQFSFSGGKGAPSALTVSNSVVAINQALLLGFQANGYGSAEFGSGSVVTNLSKIRVGGYNTADSKVFGRLEQDGGSFVSSGDLSVGYGGQNAGSYRMRSGRLETSAKVLVGYEGGAGVFRMDGGTFDQTDGALYLGDGATAGYGVFHQCGGTSSTRVNFGSATTADGAAGLLLLEGEGTTNIVANDRFIFKAVNAYSAVLAVNGDAYLRAQRLVKSEEARLSGKNRFTLSLDGGILAQTWSGSFTQDGSSPNAPPDEILVHTNGVVLAPWHDARDDVQWADSYACAFGAPTGQVVSAIALPSDAAFAADSSYMGPPRVTIAGPGTGAAAVAEYDAATRTVTGIRVVAPGTGYGAGTTASIESSDRTASYPCAVTLAAAPTAGRGLVVDAAPRIVALKGTNTYHGATCVKSGTLKLMLTESLPAGSRLVVKPGATVDFSSLAFTVPELEASGVLSNGNLSVTQRVVLPRAVSTQAHLTGRLTLADGVTIAFTDAGEALDPERRYTLLTAAGGLTRLGGVSFTGVPEDWSVRVTANSIQLVRRTGVLIILR